MGDERRFPVDELGLERVLADWSGTGNLYRAIAAVAPEALNRQWSVEDVERRAMRILLLECSALLRRWPKSQKAWRDHLPTLSSRQRFWADVPQTRVDWAKTRRQGWPPEKFAIRRRHRSTDVVTLSVLAWTLAHLKEAFDASQSLLGLPEGAFDPLASDISKLMVETLPILDLLYEADQTTPTRDEIRAVRASGWPWNVVADVAGVFLAFERGGPEALARRLLRPDGFPEALFQLSVLGRIITVCEGLGARVVSLRPIGHMTDGPVYRIELPDQEPWDLWCEAANCWKVYGVTDNYRALASGMTTADGRAFGARNIRPDVLLARENDQALVIECKFPSETLDPGYVAHGIYQAAYYAQQLLPSFHRVEGLVVGPSELVPVYAVQPLGPVQIGLSNPLDTHASVSKVLGIRDIA